MSKTLEDKLDGYSSNSDEISFERNQEERVSSSRTSFTNYQNQRDSVYDDPVHINTSTPEPSSGRSKRQLSRELSTILPIGTLRVKDVCNTDPTEDVIPEPIVVKKELCKTDTGNATAVQTKNTGPTMKVMIGIQKKRTCSYLRGGYCVLHGPGANRHWKPKMIKSKGPDGKYVMRMTKETYYVCVDNLPKNDDGVGDIRPVQTRLSFGSVLRKKAGSEDTRQGELGNNDVTVG